MRVRASWIAIAVATVWACGDGTKTAVAPPLAAKQTHSGAITVSPDGARLYVVHPDADSVTAVDPVTKSILFETLLASAPPTMDPTTQAFTPSVLPRALTLDPTGATLYVTGERSGMVYAVDARTGSRTLSSATICAEPIGILADAAGANLFVACSNDDQIVELRTSDLAVVGKASCARKPWALSWASDGQTLLATHLLGSGLTPTPANPPGVSVFASSPLALTTTWPIDDVALGSDPTVPNGEARGIYDAAVRPGTSELWVAHVMLASSTPQPMLDFNTTVFPSISVLSSDGHRTALLTVSVTDGGPSEGGSGVGGAFGDIVSGPQSITFSPDGRFAFVVDANSEDVLVIDAKRKVEAQLVRPLPGHWPMGAVFSPDGKLYVAERNTEDIAVLDVTEGSDADASAAQDASVAPLVDAVVESTTIRTLTRDPMPAQYRTGQQIFNSANSDEMPITQNHWVACATCHIEQRTDAITWRFSSGPRDTPTNAGGMIGAGFLMHTADRRQVSDYWRTIDEEQGGEFGLDVEQIPLLDALEAYVNHAIPVPVPPTTDPSLVAHGKQIFDGALGCTMCHSGPRRTDSGMSNASLDLSGPEVAHPVPGGVLVHDVGTCNMGAFPDVPHTDMNGDPRDPCRFKTPFLEGLWDSAPYMHDGSAATLDQAVGIMIAAAGSAGGDTRISYSDRQALIEYLKSL
jgi:DNA-binding beta-propeller fold protein YncE